MKKMITAMIGLSALGLPAAAVSAGDLVHDIDVADEQGEGFIPASDAETHPDPKQYYADDFTLDENTALTRIAWFGYSDYWDFPDLTNFNEWQVRIYVGQGEETEPGEMIYEGFFDQAETDPEDLGPQGLFGSTLYRQEIELNEPLELEGGQQYWLAIGADANDASGDWWLWAQAPPNDETVATWSWQNEEWEIRPPDWNPDWPTYNVAFELFGEAGGTLPGDLNGDGEVDGADLATLLSAWGRCDDPEDCPADLNEDGEVNGVDLATLLSHWTS